jgi:integrase
MKPAAAVVKHHGTEVRIYGPLADRKREIYQLAYHAGSRREKQNFKGTLDEARKKAKEVAASIGAGDVVDALHLSPLDRRIYVTAKEAAAPTGLAVDLLCRAAAAAMLVLGKEATLADAANYWKGKHNGDLPEATPELVKCELLAWMTAKRRKQVTIDSFKKLIDPFTRDFQVPVAHIQKSELDAWLARRTDLGPRSLDNVRAALVRLFNFAKGRYLPEDTITVAERLATVSTSDDERGPIEIFKPWEMVKILSCAPKRLLALILLAAFAGIRTCELARMEWSAVRFPSLEGARHKKYPHGFIVIDKAVAKKHRTAARRVIPISENLSTWLELFRFETGRISFYSTDKKISAALTNLIRRINRAEKKARRPLLSRPKNGCRHSYASYRLPVIESAAALSIEMNNSPQEIEHDYNELVMPEEVEAWWNIRRPQPVQVLMFDKEA